MGIITDAVGAATGLAGTIFGGIKGAKQRKKQEDVLNRQFSQNEELFNRQYYQDIMNRSDTANLLKSYRDTLKERNKAQRNMATVTGATPEAIAAQKKINADAYGNVMSGIAAQSSQLKDNAIDRYSNMSNYLMGKKSDMYAQRAQNYANLAANSADMLTNSVQNLGGSIEKYKENKTLSNLF